MPEQQASISDLAAWNASVTKANTPGELARQREELRHYEPLALAANASVSPSQLRENYQWVAETGDIQSYRNQETGRHLHIDAEGNFYTQKGQAISRETAFAHASAPSLEQSRPEQSRPEQSRPEPSLGLGF
jgi:hypothetical protein